MECDEAKNRLWEYLDRELDSEDADELATHLSECPHCYPAYRYDQAFLTRLVSTRSSCRAPATLLRWAQSWVRTLM